jgi:Ca-activated chloride channel family protein
MARHVVTSTRDGRGRVVLLVLVTTAVLAVLVTAVLTVNPGNILARAPVVGDTCPSTRLANTSVNIVAAPDIAPVVEQVVTPLRSRELPDGRCLQVTVSSQNPAETVAGAQILPLDRAPNLWVPDSSLWLGRIEQWKPQPITAFASSPVVVGTSAAVASSLGWNKKPPTWDAALGGSRPVAAPNIAQDAAGLSAELALWQALGKGEKAQTALAGAVLAGLRAGAPTRESAVAIAQSNAATAPLIPLTEQAVQEANRDVPDPKLVAVYPKGGLPSLDYPVARVEASDLTPEKRTAIQVIADALSAAPTRAIVRNAGFRDTGGSTTAAAGIVPAAVTPLTPPSNAEIKAVVTRIVLLSAPSRVQVVVDMSGSMRAQAGNGMTRSQFAGAAAITAGAIMPDVAQVGLWGFSRDIRGKSDRIEFQKMEELGSPDGKITHRDAVERDLRAMSKQLGGNGTALYSTAIAAMRYMKGLYDPRAGNAVVLFTDGENIDEGGPSIEATVKQLKALYDPKKPVRLICIGVGGEADIGALRKLAAAAGGEAFLTKDPGVLPEVLFRVMSRRPTA